MDPEVAQLGIVRDTIAGAGTRAVGADQQVRASADVPYTVEHQLWRALAAEQHQVGA